MTILYTSVVCFSVQFHAISWVSPVLFSILYANRIECSVAEYDFGDLISEMFWYHTFTVTIVDLCLQMDFSHAKQLISPFKYINNNFHSNFFFEWISFNFAIYSSKYSICKQKHAGNSESKYYLPILSFTMKTSEPNPMSIKCFVFFTQSF